MYLFLLIKYIYNAKYIHKNRGNLYKNCVTIQRENDSKTLCLFDTTKIKLKKYENIVKVQEKLFVWVMCAWQNDQFTIFVEKKKI